jgi:multidrug efflux pump subunit AcrA (membrane-fusion protein)
MNVCSLHPWLYQLRHPWHWLTYGQNATAFGIILATAVNLLAVYVLFRTLVTVNRQAQAADRQAEAAEAQAAAARKQTEVSEQQRIAAERAANAAEEQVEAAKSATKVSEAQRIATEQGAMAEREHSELIRQQLLATLRPILVITKHDEGGGNMEYRVENHGEGVALAVKANYRGRGLQDIYISHDILGPSQSAVTALRWETFQADGMQVRYESQDGRFFVTTAFANGLELRQTAFEVDANGGYLNQPRIVPERKN